MAIISDELKKAELDNIKSKIPKKDTTDSSKQTITTAKKVNSLDEARADGVRKDNQIKEKYANYIIWILIVQLSVMNLIFISAGLNWLKFEASSLNFFMSGTLAEVFGLAFIITRYLFPKK